VLLDDLGSDERVVEGSRHSGKYYFLTGEPELEVRRGTLLHPAASHFLINATPS
jgi:hypothetical protein